MSLTKVKAGNILLTTPAASSNDVTPATTQYVTTALANMVDSAPSTLNTLNELAAALGDDANFSTTVTNSIAAKAPLASPTFTGTITGPHIVSTSNTATQFKNATDTDVQNKFETNSSADYALHRLIGSDGVDNKLVIGYGPNHGSTPNHMALKNNHASGSIGFNTGASSIERMHVTSGGNVGIGTANPGQQLDISNSSHAVMRLHAGTNSSASLRLQNDAQHWDVNLQTSDKFAVYDHTTNTQPFTILPTSGNVGIAVNDPDSRLEIKSAGGGSESALKVTDASSNNVFIQQGGGRAIFHYGPVMIAAETDIMHANMDDLQVGNAVGNRGMTIASGNGSYGTLAFADGSSGNAAYRGFVEYFHNEDSMRLGTSGTEKLRIGSTGVVMISTSNTKSAGDNPSDENSSVIGPGYLYLQRDDSASINQIVFGKDGQIAGRIITTTATSLVSASDYRMKENVDYTWDATTRLKQLKPARYNWIADETNTLEDGFLAHEVASVVPNAVFGQKDAVDSDGNPEMQGVDSSKLIPLLVKTIQELEARIETLEG